MFARILSIIILVQLITFSGVVHAQQSSDWSSSRFYQAYLSWREDYRKWRKKRNSIDSTAPVLTIPGYLEIEAQSSQGAEVSYRATASDNKDGSVNVTCSPVSGSLFSVAETTVNCQASDSSGNKASGSFTVSVVDTKPPALVLPGMLERDSENGGSIAVDYTVSASDIVDNSVDAQCSPASGSMFEIGSTTVSCSAVDDANNRASGSFIVAVVDAMPEPSEPLPDPEPIAPLVSIAIPSTDVELLAGESLGVIVNAEAYNGVIESCELYLNGDIVRQEFNSPYTWGAATDSEDPILRNLAAGTYQLTANCTDSTGAASSDSLQVSVIVDQEPELVAYSVDLSWQIPTTRTDGTALSVSDIASYSLVYDDDAGLANSTIVDIPVKDESGSLVSHHTIPSLESGIYYFALSVSDTQGNLSELSDLITVDLP